MTLVSLRRALVPVAALLIAVACRDGSAPTSSGPEPSSVLSPTGAGSAPADTNRGATPPAPATATALTVHVGLAVAGPDTLRSTPLESANVSVFGQTTVRTTGGGPDTLTVIETLAATGSTNASGDVVFGGLPSQPYRIMASRAGDGASATVRIAPPYPSAIRVALIITANP